jgi:protein NRD1
MLLTPRFLLKLDTQLVSTMYRAHKSLPASSKISSLYVFDALSRAARQQVVKHNLSERQATGNCATFLLKIAGVLDGLFQDMLATELPEAKVSFLTFSTDILPSSYGD